MGLFNLFNTFDPVASYDAIDAVAVQSNLLMMTESKEHQAAIKKLRIGSLVNLKHTKRKGQNIYVVSDFKTGKTIGEISYGSSDYLAQNYKEYRLLGKITEIGRITPNGHGIQVRIEYKVYP